MRVTTFLETMVEWECKFSSMTTTLMEENRRRDEEMREKVPEYGRKPEAALLPTVPIRTDFQV